MIVHFPEVDRNNIAELSQKTLWEEESEDVSEALKYLREERCLTDDVIKRFHFGYYPKRLKMAGHDWAGRLIMPLYDQNNKLIVLTSRDFRCKSNSGMPHLHEEFDKKFYMFGVDVAKSSIIKHQKVIIVEGQFDTARSHSCGIGITVGILGSAFSLCHVCTLSRYCSEFFLVFDRDDSGFRNLNRSMKMYKEYGLKSLGINFIPVLLPIHKDPDEFLKKEPREDYLNLLSESKKKVEEIGSVEYYDFLCRSNPEIKIIEKGK